MDKPVLHPIFKQFLNWWSQGLKAWLPKSWQSWSRLGRHIRIELVNEQLKLSLVERSGEVPDSKKFDLNIAGSSPAIVKWLKSYPRLKFVFFPHEEQYLLKQFQLPISSQNSLSKVIHFEVERQTPFFTEEVMSVYQSDIDGKTINIDLAVIPKKYTEKIEEQLQLFGIKPSWYVLGDQGKSLFISSLPDRLEAGSSTQTQRLTGWLMLLCFLLFIISLYQPVIYYENATESIQSDVNTAKREAQQVRALQNQNNELLATRASIENVQLNYDSRLLILSQLSQLIPSDSWLVECAIEQNSLRLRGYTASKAELLTILSSIPWLEDVKLTQSVQSIFSQNTQPFHIEAKLKLSGGGNV